MFSAKTSQAKTSKLRGEFRELEKKIKKKENAEKDKKPNLIKAQTQVKHLEKAVKESKKKLEAVYQTFIVCFLEFPLFVFDRQKVKPRIRQESSRISRNSSRFHSCSSYRHSSIQRHLYITQGKEDELKSMQEEQRGEDKALDLASDQLKQYHSITVRLILDIW